MGADFVAVKVWGDLALFTRPELKVERVSYPIMTPSAARGVLDAIMYRPQMRWHVRRIKCIEPQFPEEFPEAARKLPYRLIPVRRNEIQDKISGVEKWMKDESSYQPYFVDSAGRDDVQGAHRTQRNSLLLQHVAYIIEATPVLTRRANQVRVKPEDSEDHGPDTIAKYVAMFQRRVAKGQCFHHPYLGCREFVCHFSPPTGSETLLNWTSDLGLMLYDIRHCEDGTSQPGFFMAQVRDGILHCDTDAFGPGGEPPIQVLGWSSDG